ncbi:hypothetical protein [Pleionea sp. CnH1-48]|uniref:hypothetical protein n=1 Tax=Pleionea sp. CnH1-48 TaxID=2954494 RepID=UPI00209743BB|nr:hypothetical protein [Pleionea sp. CnH1-48]MCO7224235.1 hypothetical protein [Pleionea sp. CnH1-48]
MNESSHPVQSTRTLFKASIAATIIAVLTLVLVILPAEYNIDITGFGRATGISQLAAPTQVSAPTLQSSALQSSKTEEGENDYRSDTVTLTIPAGAGIEYKFFLAEYGRLEYQWKTKKGQLYYDFHGEPDGDSSGFFESYVIGRDVSGQGTMTVPFAGTHGWYWRNDTAQDILVELRSAGVYKVVGLKK